MDDQDDDLDDGFGREEAEPERPDFGWPRPGKFSPDELVWVLKLRKDGLSLRAIGSLTGRGFSHVSRVCIKAGIQGDVSKPAEPAVRAYLAESELGRTLRLLGEKAAKKADVMLNQIDSPIKVRRINTRTGATERLRLSQPDPSEQRDLAGGARSLIDVVARTVLVAGNTGSQGAIIELVNRVRESVDHPTGRVVAMNQVLKGELPTSMLEWHQQSAIVLEFEGATEAINPGGFEPTAAQIRAAKSALKLKPVKPEPKPSEKVPDVQLAPTGPFISREHNAAITD